MQVLQFVQRQQQTQVTQIDIKDELNRLGNIIRFDDNPITVKAAAQKKEWVMEWIREERKNRRHIFTSRSQLPNLSEVES